MEVSGTVTLPRSEYDLMVTELESFRREEREKVKNLTSALEAIEKGDSYLKCRSFFPFSSYEQRTVYTKDETVKALVKASKVMEDRNLFERIFNK
jgi:hypothetical protein